ncbi:Putative nucleoside phosphorylase superfamily [Colletotrichum destructivum]|uniref:Nucleoside phosphorylase superfamily n=1 Tax=Colletotrichum destructivum TaxID=34406 RepID=A0AAX4I533_9PEZI|nr:Putative nucleoside phosphorylase superfamily [Colletotrichum destructivum]
MGKFSAANETNSLRSTYTEIQLTFLTGICDGVLDPWEANELVLGDVVVSKSMIQYDLERHCGSTRTTTL